MTDPSTPPSVLIIGAGELGTAVLEALAKHPKRNGGRIAVLLRPPTTTTITDDPANKKAKVVEHIHSLDATLETADVATASVADLAAVFARYDVVVACAGFGLPAGTQVKVTRAALLAASAGKRMRYIPWQWGIDYDVVGQGSAQDLFDEQLQVRQLLRSQSQLGWTIASTGLFMSFLFLPAFGVVDIKGETVRALGGWDRKITLTAARDIGRMAAVVVYEPRGEEEEEGVVYVAGDTVTYARVAELVEGRFGGEWKREVWTEEGLKERLKENPEDGMLKYASVWAKGDGVAWEMEETLNRRRGVEMMGLEGYLREMAMGDVE
ncbi:NAD(P)-binding protein [Hypoxylon fragiforme]|uniref:NAD(P)-binding protein n=1 Tax=Hypoxylon fragiforme TaxID=63214 RepID=UPI0020C6CAB3|nr:NAD(P)-binding protein [Hypoxylon fragiforme]KAI2613167.1 NAD(P)-binding protein [Hypoxylon fragiforme]